MLHPKLVRDFLELFLALRVAGQPRDALGFRPDDRRPGLHQLVDLFHHRQRHHRTLGQHQHLVAHPVGQHDAPVFHREPGENDFRVADIVIVAEAARGIDVLRRDKVGRLVSAVIEHVGHKDPLPQQLLAAGQIAEERADLVPPGDVVVEVRARGKDRARLPVLRA